MTHQDTLSWLGPTPFKLKDCYPGLKENSYLKEHSVACPSAIRFGKPFCNSSKTIVHRDHFNQEIGNN